ncbi:SLC13 family permease [Candidatus Hydrogenedentota bacterium]
MHSRILMTRSNLPFQLFSLLAGAVLALLVLWAMMSPGADPAPAAGASTTATAAVILAFVGAFGALALNVVNRLTAVAVGAFASLLIGALLRFYFPSDAVLYLFGKMDTLILLAGMSIVTGLLQESGFFGILAHNTLRVSGGNPWKVMTFLCVLTYGLSMFMNNLAAILVIIPIALRVTKAMEMEPVPLVMGVIIASNLGGASTMVGDFPNMLIATETGLAFHEFFIHLAPVCLLQLGILIVFLRPSFADRPLEKRRRASLLEGLCTEHWDHAMGARGIAILGATIVGFLVAGRLGIPVAAVAGSGAVLAFLLGNVSWKRLLKRMCFGDVLFFACLFLMVGALNATGFLDNLGSQIAAIWMHSPVWGAIALAWGAALLTCFLSAGPSTALLIHVLLASTPGFASGESVWWALSLGVCAGSSATLTGATAGPVTASLLEREGYTLTFERFAYTGVPIMFLFLIVSSCYLAIIGS